jgi:hypothetical protein
VYMTVLSGHVSQENWPLLQRSFQKLCAHPPATIIEIELVQARDDPSMWKVVVLWASQEAYEEAVRSNITPACEQMFCNAGSVPERTHYRLVTRYQRV